MTTLRTIKYGKKDPDDKSQIEVLADFRQAWHEAMTGQTIPVAQLWERFNQIIIAEYEQGAIAPSEIRT
jgi:hypothetical protein